MGSRRAGDFRKFTGRSKATTTGVHRIQTALKENSPARIVVGTAVDLLATSNPVIGTLVATYKVSKAVYDIAYRAEKAYQKTGNVDAAVSAAAKEVVKTVVDVTRGEAISNIVDVGWAAIKSSVGISTQEVQDKILTTATKNTLDEALPK